MAFLLENFQNKMSGTIDSHTLEDIYRIGEPIIRNILLQEYDNKRDTLSNVKRVTLLKEELAKLESNKQ